ncbi:MAG: phosphotransferase [Lachnospiraceae bacterium]|nr:phosphotransferase [Lachnospiraceae bacterium]
MEQPRAFDIRDEFKKTDRVRNYLNYFKGTGREIARLFVLDQSPDLFMKTVKEKKNLNTDLVNLRNTLVKMPKISAVTVKVAGTPVRIVRDDTTIEVTIENRSIMLPFNSLYLADKIDSDICEHVEAYQDQDVLQVLKSLRKPDNDMTPGDVGRLRQRCLSVLKKAIGKNAGYFSNISYSMLYDYAIGLLSGKMNKTEIMYEISQIENVAVEKVNGAEAIAFLQRTEKQPQAKLAENAAVEIKKTVAAVNEPTWSPEEARIKNFIADLMFGEESWNTTDQYIDEKESKSDNRAKQKESRIYDMLIPGAVKENKNFNTFLLMINHPELIRRTVEKMALPNGGDDEGLDNVKDMIINQIEAVVTDPAFDEIRNTEGNFLVSKEFVQKAKLAAGLSLMSKEIKEKMKEAERLIDQKVLMASKGLQEEIEKAVDNMFGGDNALDNIDNVANLSPKQGSAYLQKIIEDAAKGRKGQGLFTKLVLKNYFVNMSYEDQRKMFASAIRNAGIRKNPEELDTVEKREAYEKEKEGCFLGGLFKGAGPLLQKMLQGLPDSSLPDKLKLAVKDMKSNLNPIPEQVVKAQLLSLVQRSHDKLTKIEVSKSLGAASVGQAFLCKAFGPNLPEEGKEVVVKILRPDARNRMEREKHIMRECARMTDTTGGMLATYEGQLERFDEEVDLTIEARNVLAGQIYDKGAGIVQSMKLSDLAEPTENAMIVEMAPGTTVDKYMEDIDKEKEELITPFYKINKDGSVNKNSLKITQKNYMKRAALRTKLIELKNQLEKRQTYIVKLAEKWVMEGIYGAGFYHGDLHSGNIMIDDNLATVIDFGNCTQLSKNQQEKIMLMMTSATVKDAKSFLHGFHQLLEKTPEEYYQMNRAKLLKAFEDIMKLGTEQDVGQRILAALIKAQELGFEMPAAVFNFSQAQQRLHNTIEDMNAKLKELHETIRQVDDMDIAFETDPVLNILHDPDVRTNDQSKRIARLKELYTSSMPDPQPILKDFNSMKPEEFENKYLRSKDMPTAILKCVEYAVNDLEKQRQSLQERPNDQAEKSVASMLLRSAKTSAIIPFQNNAEKFLNAEEKKAMNNEINIIPNDAESYRLYIDNLNKWLKLVRERSAGERLQLSEAVNALNEVKQNPLDFSAKEKRNREQKLLTEYRKLLLNDKKGFDYTALGPIKDMLHKSNDQNQEEELRKKIEKDFELMFADEEHRGPELKEAYENFRMVQDEHPDDSAETNAARNAFMGVLREITLDKLKVMIDEEKDLSNEVPAPKTFFDMMGHVLEQNKLASIRRLGIVNTGKFVVSGKLGLGDAISAIFS